MQATQASFDWVPHPQAAMKIKAALTSFLASFLPAAILAGEMTSHTSTRFSDWVDTLFLPYSTHEQDTWLSLGFVPLDTIVPQPILDNQSALAILHHPGALFPQIVLWNSPHIGVAIKVDSVTDFLQAHALSHDIPILGGPYSKLRIASAWSCPTHTLFAIERHGTRSYRPLIPTDPDRIKTITHLESFTHRRRNFNTDEEGFTHAQNLIHAAIDDLGQSQACDLFFQVERHYWQSRNTAAQIQKKRQDTLGLGWANHDHHTYRSSRAGFKPLIDSLLLLGFKPRERFYAGADAGWGAQVLDHETTGITVFADVDLSPHEVAGNFAQTGLSPSASLGTVGLWCALHGESFLQAGMHHLECQFDFTALRQQLQDRHGIAMMKPFTDFSFLRQAFTQGEVWPVDPARLAALRAQNLITPEQADKFAKEGALGSHLENLQREDGFKGFNQTGINQIIQQTDPRNQAR